MQSDKDDNEVIAVKVNGINNISGINKYNRNPEPRTISANKSGQRDELTISNEAKELLDTQSVSGAADLARVQQLKDQVSSGTYYVDAKKIAEKLLPYIK